MYIPTRHSLNERETLFSLMDAHPLGAWVCRGRDELIANHIPFVLDRRRGPHGTVHGLQQSACPFAAAMASLVKQAKQADSDGPA